MRDSRAIHATFRVQRDEHNLEPGSMHKPTVDSFVYSYNRENVRADLDAIFAASALESKEKIV